MENKELEFKYSRIGRMTRMGIEKVPMEKIIQEKKKFVNEVTKQARKRKSKEKER